MSDLGYELLGVTGRGAFGVTYLARVVRAEGDEAVVYLKVADPDLGRRAVFLRLLQDLVRTLQRAEHPALVVPRDLLKLDGQWTLVSERAEGVDLRRIVSRGAVPASVAIELVAELAGGLHAAIAAGGSTRIELAHGNLTPENVLVTASGRVRVLDFGLGTVVSRARQLAGAPALLHRLEYLAPERLDDEVGVRSDVYALGVLLYQLMTGRHPGRGSGNLGRHMKRVEAALTEARSAFAIPAEVVQLVGSMLGYLPEYRPTLRGVQRDVERLRPGVAGPSLATWAAEMVPGLDDGRPSFLDARVELAPGAVLHPPLPDPGAGDPLDAPAPVTMRRASLPPMPAPIDPEDAHHTGPPAPARVRLGPSGEAVPEEPPEPTPPPPPEREAFDTSEDVVASLPKLSARPSIRPMESPVDLPEPPSADVLGDEIARWTQPPPPPRRLPPAATEEAAQWLKVLVGTGTFAVVLLPFAVLLAVIGPPGGDAPAEGPVTAPAEVAAPDPEAPPRPTPRAPPRQPVGKEGDARSVWLVSGGDRYELPAEVPPGTWAILASFGADEPAHAGTVEVPEDGDVVVTCQAAERRCETR